MPTHVNYALTVKFVVCKSAASTALRQKKQKVVTIHVQTLDHYDMRNYRAKHMYSDNKKMAFFVAAVNADWKRRRGQQVKWPPKSIKEKKSHHKKPHETRN